MDRFIYFTLLFNICLFVFYNHSGTAPAPHHISRHPASMPCLHVTRLPVSLSSYLPVSLSYCLTTPCLSPISLPISLSPVSRLPFSRLPVSRLPVSLSLCLYVSLSPLSFCVPVSLSICIPSLCLPVFHLPPPLTPLPIVGHNFR